MFLLFIPPLIVNGTFPLRLKVLAVCQLDSVSLGLHQGPGKNWAATYTGGSWYRAVHTLNSQNDRHLMDNMERVLWVYP
jgi:hypothetical protein